MSLLDVSLGAYCNQTIFGYSILFPNLNFPVLLHLCHVSIIAQHKDMPPIVYEVNQEDCFVQLNRRRCLTNKDCRERSSAHKLKSIPSKTTTMQRRAFEGRIVKKPEIDLDNEIVPSKDTRDKEFGNYSSSENKAFIESFILRILSCKGISKTMPVMHILRTVYLGRKLFTQQQRMVEMDAPVKICGDTHGQYGDLIRLFEKGGFPPQTNYLFLGDYVDRGRHGLEVVLILLGYKIRYPKNIFMLRGNHECAHINSTYGFKDEIMNRKSSHAITIYDEFKAMFNMMPLTALVAERILCMHGGISRHLTNLSDLRNVIVPTEAVSEGLEMDLLWADPMSSQMGFKPNLRGASVSFGEDVVYDMCKNLDIDLIVRAHQVVQDGYEFFANRHLVTIFSAPHYCGQFDNSSAMCVISEGLEVTFEILKPMQLETVGGTVESVMKQ